MPYKTPKKRREWLKNRTVINIKRSTRDKLAKLGYKDESWDDILNKLADFWLKSRKSDVVQSYLDLYSKDEKIKLLNLFGVKNPEEIFIKKKLDDEEEYEDDEDDEDIEEEAEV